MPAAVARAILACVQAFDASTQEQAAVRLGFLLHRLLGTAGTEFLRRIDDLGLSLSQVKALHLLGEGEGDRTLKDLGDELGLSLPAMSRAVDALVKRGLVNRAEDAEDRRFKRVCATAAGRELTRELVGVRLAGLEEFIATLDERQRKALERALELIVPEVPR